MKIALRDKRLAPHVHVSSEQFPSMPEAPITVGDTPVKVSSKPYWTEDVPRLGLAAAVEAGVLKWIAWTLRYIAWTESSVA